MDHFKAPNFDFFSLSKLINSITLPIGNSDNAVFIQLHSKDLLLHYLPHMPAYPAFSHNGWHSVKDSKYLKDFQHHEHSCFFDLQVGVHAGSPVDETLLFENHLRFSWIPATALLFPIGTLCVPVKDEANAADLYCQLSSPLCEWCQLMMFIDLQEKFDPADDSWFKLPEDDLVKKFASCLGAWLLPKRYTIYLPNGYVLGTPVECLDFYSPHTEEFELNLGNGYRAHFEIAALGVHLNGTLSYYHESPDYLLRQQLLKIYLEKLFSQFYHNWEWESSAVPMKRNPLRLMLGALENKRADWEFVAAFATSLQQLADDVSLRLTQVPGLVLKNAFYPTDQSQWVIYFNGKPAGPPGDLIGYHLIWHLLMNKDISFNGDEMFQIKQDNNLGKKKATASSPFDQAQKQDAARTLSTHDFNKPSKIEIDDKIKEIEKHLFNVEKLSKKLKKQLDTGKIPIDDPSALPRLEALLKSWYLILDKANDLLNLGIIREGKKYSAMAWKNAKSFEEHLSARDASFDQAQFSRIRDLYFMHETRRGDRHGNKIIKDIKYALIKMNSTMQEYFNEVLTIEEEIFRYNSKKRPDIKWSLSPPAAD